LTSVRALVIGSGGREHALVVGLAADPDVTEVHAAPGNAGIAADASAVHDVQATDPNAVVALTRRVGADLVVVGPEAPLVAGVADAVRAAGVACFGPSAAAARLEGSKAFAKDVMASAGVPTAMAHVCDTAEEVAAALDAFGAPYVVKDDGLAAGKGVVVTDDRDVALAHAAACDQVLVEEYLDGPEVSLFCLSDGHTARALQPAQDFKRIGDGDTGPNTGGMGAYTPLPWAPADLVPDVLERVVQPTIDEMAARGTPFTGLLYAGLALTSRGLRVVEFNARFGDPETQAVLALESAPLGTLLLAAATGGLSAVEIPHFRTGAAVTVVVAAPGYPGTPRTGDPIRGLAEAGALEGVRVLHAGTRLVDGQVVSAGGRVLSVTAVGDDLARARDRAYEAVRLVDLAGGQYRTDIAARAVAGEVTAPPLG
jgi:phosphoribosylamine--glycine ligase